MFGISWRSWLGEIVIAVVEKPPRFLKGLWGADMEPLTAVGNSIEVVGFLGFVIEKVERKRSFWGVREQPRMENLHPGEHIGRRLLFSTPGEQA
jgi:hypothetical protein